TLASAFSTQRLDVRTASSRTYLARVSAAQQVAAAQLRRAIPEASIGRRFRIVLDGLTVSVPAKRLPALVRLGFVAKVYPSVRFTLLTDRSPEVIGADVLHAATGARGDGIKIGVVDDGVDQTNPFFSPAGYTYPTGFPRGDTSYTTPKVIVARSFPGPGSGNPGKLPVDRAASFHGTHVAGIAAGDEGTNAPAGPVTPAGNDRDDFGPGSTGSPGTAPAGIAVAAVTNSHIFTPALSVSDPGAPASVQQIPIENQLSTPASWGFSDNPLVDVSSIVVNGQPSDPYLCGPAQNPNAPVATLPYHSLDGAIALVLRGRCAFVTKSARAQVAGAIG